MFSSTVSRRPFRKEGGSGQNWKHRRIINNRVANGNRTFLCLVRCTLRVGFYVGVGEARHVIIVAVIGRSRSRGRIFYALLWHGPSFNLSMDIGRLRHYRYLPLRAQAPWSFIVLRSKGALHWPYGAPWSSIVLPLQGSFALAEAGSRKRARALLSSSGQLFLPR